MHLTARLALAKFNREHYDDPDPEDNLRAGRGILYGFLGGLVLWAVILTIVFA